MAKAVSEEQVKTAYLLNIAKFSSWSEHETISLCLADTSAIYPYVIQLHQAAIDSDRALAVITNPDNLSQCQILYWDSAADTKAPDLLQAPHKGLMIVSDMNDAISRGASVQLFLRANKLRFAIDTARLKQLDFKISSKLLRLARRLQ